MFAIEYCKTKKGYEAKPTKQIKLNLKKLKDLQGAEILADAALVVVVRIAGEELIVHSYGGILFKTLNKEDDTAREIALCLAQQVYNCCLEGKYASTKTK